MSADKQSLHQLYSAGEAMKIIVITVLAVVLSGCLSTYQPIPDNYNGNTSTINDSFTNKEDTSAHFFLLYKIDDNHVQQSWGKTRMDNYGQGMRFTPSMVSREVMSKKQKLTLKGLVFFPTDAQLLFGDDMSIIKEFIFTPEAGETYTVRGKLSESGSSVWLENSAGEIVEGSLGKIVNK
ncbi:hypothetical protein WCX18_06030 [Sulfurimonas sp. HSL1-2]|uniref:hypothetical protein n=1 Tax=Thiomicrolovo zhangzhouensis TaxID=3131933 RepID=UPI0031F87212